MVEGKGFDAGRESNKRIMVKGHQGDLKNNPVEDFKCMLKSKPTRYIFLLDKLCSNLVLKN
jgi:hypothetical protein